ncbi:hypothetical protein EDM58_02465 [Brevibacillus panacihumi]|uniref:Uncharacterized protein n=1 Tax=Brevibacillus panacihumi TaxID=497735 RepID=A0A3M8DEH6_9BACL|nr:hypothetical protein EDM58_02465 [Brevibacillus panacihumi]
MESANISKHVNRGRKRGNTNAGQTAYLVLSYAYTTQGRGARITMILPLFLFSSSALLKEENHEV